MMHKNKSVDLHQFAMIPRADIPRSSFRRQSTHKTTFDAGYLVPVYVDEVLPGDTFKFNMTAFCRMSTPIYPVMDNLYMDSFFFFVPNRLVWDSWKKFMGEQANPADSISFSVPLLNGPLGGFPVGSIFDYFGLPCVGQITGATFANQITVLPLRAYNLIWNTWFRDENLQNSVTVTTNDSNENYADFALLRRGKRHDYFTSCLPWPQKGGTAVTLPLGTSAPVVFGAGPTPITSLGSGGEAVVQTSAAGATSPVRLAAGNTGLNADLRFFGSSLPASTVDLSAATAATINQIRQSFQIQKLLERDARGGTRYTELVRSHFGVISPDARLQRPEYLGGGTTSVNIHPITQNTQTGVTGGTTPLGTLGGIATALSSRNGFTQSFTEHGYVIGLVAVRADLTYQQGIRKMWSRRTRYDFYFPVFAALGEQAVLNQEIYADGSANDLNVFGYQERWAEYRYLPSMITGLFKSTSAGTIDGWHLAQKFTALPTLNSTFIQDTPPLSRVLAVGAGANGQQFLFDSFIDIQTTRQMPLYSVPGLIDHF